MAMRPVTVIWNPAAGRGASQRAWNQVSSLLARYPDLRVTERKTWAKGDAFAWSKEAAEQGVDLVIVCGGDGTVNEVASGLVDTDSRMGIVPLGTGNDLARCLGIGLDIGAAVTTAIRGKPTEMDVGTWRCGERDGVFVNVAGVGFDATVAQRVNRGFRLLRGTSAYVAAVMQTLVSFRPAAIELLIDGRPNSTTMMLCAVANASSYGGGMQIAPNAELDDGRFDVVLIEGVGRYEFLCAFPRVFGGTHVSHPKVHVEHGKEISIQTDPPVPVLADGELIGTTPVSFGLRHKALHVMIDQ